MPRSLAKGHTKFAILTVKPANPAAPTITELAAGIDASCAILDADFNWSAADSDKIAEAALCTTNNANAIGASNYTTGFSGFREFDESTKNGHATADAIFAALKTKGITVWCYARKTAKLSTDPWADQDEIYLGGEVINDLPQEPTDMGGYIKKRFPLEMQVAYDNITATAGSSSSSSSSSS